MQLSLNQIVDLLAKRLGGKTGQMFLEEKRSSSGGEWMSRYHFSGSQKRAIPFFTPCASCP